ncbi:MAG: Ig-like domain-containing protein, partial [Anaerolineales bacterium]
DDAESVLVGDNAVTTLYSEENFTGHSQVIIQDTAYMQYLWVYGNTLSSMKVSLRDALPQPPIPISPIEPNLFREGDVIPLSWLNGGGATEYKVEIYLNLDLIRTVNWHADPIVYVNSLAQNNNNNYSWRVQGRNFAGLSEWSQLFTFTIASPLIVASIETVPYSDTMETTQSEWVGSASGLWSYKSNSALAHSGTHSWWYQNSYGDYNEDLPNSGSLTSPPISIPNAGYYLRFYYRYQTETQGTTWDQRWVEISVDGGPFTNLVQVYDDPQIPETSSWLRNKAIDLSEYAGHVIRIRFQFSTLDAAANNFSGWGIDDFSITTTPPSTCGENYQDDTPAQAIFLTYNPTITIPGKICPNGDYDYYKFFGRAGDRIVAEIDAMINGSLLDSYLYLLDTDGQTVLAENDDEVYIQRRDPLIGYTLSRDGIYYLKLKAWKHPLVGGGDYFYTIRLYEDHIIPDATITWPASNSYLPDTNMTVTANVSEINNGVSRVEFYWHSTYWLSGLWEKLGTDWDGSNGWSMEFNPAGQQEGNNAAFFIQVYDMAGNWTGVGAWNLGIDKTAPITAIKPLAPTQPSNAFLLEWAGSDNLSGIDYVEIQEKLNNESWTTYPPVNGSKTKYWIIGDPGNTYSYRMHGVDRSRNVENYPTLAETYTSIQAANVICNARDSYDTSGNDNSSANASMIYANGASQIHNYCNPLSPDYQNDEDWAKLMVTQGERYFIRGLANSLQTATVISLFAQDGTSLLAQSTPMEFGANTLLIWTSDRDGPVYLRFTHLDHRVIGTSVASTISVQIGTITYLPLINR